MRINNSKNITGKGKLNKFMLKKNVNGSMLKQEIPRLRKLLK